MSTEHLFPIKDLCRPYQAEVSFIHELHDNGLVEIVVVEDEEYVEEERLSEVERFMRMHYELSINLQGLEAIHHLLHKVEGMQQELQDLQHRLDLYEEEG